MSGGCSTAFAVFMTCEMADAELWPHIALDATADAPSSIPKAASQASETQILLQLARDDFLARMLAKMEEPHVQLAHCRISYQNLAPSADVFNQVTRPCYSCSPQGGHVHSQAACAVKWRLQACMHAPAVMPWLHWSSQLGSRSSHGSLAACNSEAWASADQAQCGRLTNCAADHRPLPPHLGASHGTLGSLPLRGLSLHGQGHCAAAAGLDACLCQRRGTCPEHRVQGAWRALCSHRRLPCVRSDGLPEPRPWIHTAVMT